MTPSPKILEGFPPDSICRLQAASNYTLIFKKDGSKLISSYSLSVFSKIFDSAKFLQIDRSNLVHTTFIKSVEKENGKNTVKLQNDMSISIPRRQNHSLKIAYPTIF